jgi:GrpB-like predicted nucleotidyltransferase (UPF0157 family)
MGIMGTFPAKIEHVGSTSIPGAAAKPIIDIDIVVRSRWDVKRAIRMLEEGGYKHVGDKGIPGREAFESPGGMIAHHLYVVVEGNSAHDRHLKFRDYLRINPEMVHRYSALKKSLANQFRNDREAYTEAKTTFVEDVLRQAEKGET